MDLTPAHLRKVDTRLRDALEGASGDERLRAVVLLRGGGDGRDGTGPEPDPSDFATREAYRRALIDWRSSHTARQIGGTVEALRRLELAPRGGAIGRTVVVEGPARRLLAALDLSGVEHATLDRPLEGPRPRRPKVGGQ